MINEDGDDGELLALEDAIDGVDLALGHAGEACRALAEHLGKHDVDNDSFLRGIRGISKTPKEQIIQAHAARQARRLTHPGSSSARMALQILLTSTVQDAIDFIDTLEFYEHDGERRRGPSTSPGLGAGGGGRPAGGP